jgi:hypothetical protein
MKARLGLLAGLGLVVAFLLSREASRAVSPPREGTALEPLSQAAPPPAGASPWPVPARDPFRYGAAPSEPASPRPRVIAPARDVVPEPTPPPRPSLRLVGFVHNAAGLRAALSLDGDVALVGLGESAYGFTVVRLDEDMGVEVRGPDGRELVIAPPPAP